MLALPFRKLAGPCSKPIIAIKVGRDLSKPGNRPGAPDHRGTQLGRIGTARRHRASIQVPGVPAEMGSPDRVLTFTVTILPAGLNIEQSWRNGRLYRLPYWPIEDRVDQLPVGRHQTRTRFHKLIVWTYGGQPFWHANHHRSSVYFYPPPKRLEFSREDGSLFTDQEAQDFLSKLALFLSFCRGHWVGLSLVVGLDESAEAALEQWGTGRVSTWREPSGWLDEHHGNCIGQLYEKFSLRLLHESWRDAVSHVVYWFARADTNNVGPDGACILLQAALERLAWHVLVRERNSISEQGFRDLTAAGRLRLMLNTLSIPTTIPTGLTELHALRRSRTSDGPEVFTLIRNRLTHPPKLSARKEQLPYYQAYCLAKWYVELAILSACGYTSEYGNRTMLRRWKGQVEKVPWA